MSKFDDLVIFTLGGIAGGAIVALIKDNLKDAKERELFDRSLKIEEVKNRIKDEEAKRDEHISSVMVSTTDTIMQRQDQLYIEEFSNFLEETRKDLNRVFRIDIKKLIENVKEETRKESVSDIPMKSTQISVKDAIDNLDLDEAKLIEVLEAIGDVDTLASVEEAWNSNKNLSGIYLTLKEYNEIEIYVKKYIKVFDREMREIFVTQDMLLTDLANQLEVTCDELKKYDSSEEPFSLSIFNVKMIENTFNVKIKCETEEEFRKRKNIDQDKKLSVMNFPIEEGTERTSFAVFNNTKENCSVKLFYETIGLEIPDNEDEDDDEE